MHAIPLQLTSYDRFLIIAKDCPHTALMSFKHRFTLPLPYSPDSSCTVPAPADDIVPFLTYIQGANIVSVPQQQRFRIVFGRFARLPGFYYRIFAA